MQRYGKYCDFAHSDRKIMFFKTFSYDKTGLFHFNFLSLPSVKHGFSSNGYTPCRISRCIGHQSSMSRATTYRSICIALSSRWGDPKEWPPMSTLPIIRCPNLVFDLRPIPPYLDNTNASIALPSVRRHLEPVEKSHLCRSVDHRICVFELYLRQQQEGAFLD